MYYSFGPLLNHTFFFVNKVMPIWLFQTLSGAMHETWSPASTFTGYTMAFVIFIAFIDCNFICCVCFSFISVGTLCIAEFEISRVLDYNRSVKISTPKCMLRLKLMYKNTPKLLLFTCLNFSNKENSKKKTDGEDS